ncbi:Mur ligase family protein [uncultured Methanobrevibacter sp.]|uniref:Mur ligase family protein n=1 Tax=uncultured Methanobrevibacter sp. TaxID=253161 RepID=UPI0025DE98FB|nr:Mur ligase family protein [uncultured Methanobrevibacter sp.]
MNVIVVGAGNAGRPVARLLNYAGHTVKITDPKKIEDFHMDVQKTLRLMESEGVELDLGVFEPNLDGIDTVYLSPTVPENAPAYKIIKEANLNVFSNDDFGRLADSFIDIDIIGITGSVGKTSTTHMVTEIFRTAGYQVWICSSMTQNLVSEVIVDGIIKGIPEKSDIAVLELPHGTAGLMAELQLKVGALLNIYEEHLSEFGGSMELYTQRKMFIAKNSENFITSIHCKDTVKEARPDAIFYAMVKDLPGYDPSKKSEYFDKVANFEEVAIGEGQVCNFIGDSAKGAIDIAYKFRNKSNELKKGNFTSDFHMMSYYYENAVAATAIAMAYGLPVEIIKEGLANFKGLSVHMEYIGDYNGREVYIDASYLIEGITAALDFLGDRSLVLLLDNFDTSTYRDKKETGKLMGKYADVMVATGFNEVYQRVDLEPAQELLDAAVDSDAVKVIAGTMEEGAELAIKYSKPGDTILHLGPQLMQDPEGIMEKIVTGLEEGCKKYD